MKKPRGDFQVKNKNNIIEVWMGTPNDPESELVCCFDKSYLLSFIAVLKNEIEY